MAYATRNDLVPLRLTEGDLAELTSEDDLVDETVVQAALDEASSTVDAYCGQRYQTPLQASGLVKQMTVDLALYVLASRRRDTPVSETWTQRRDNAMLMLRDVTAGRASLDQPATATTAQSSSADVTVPDKPQIFNDCALRGFC